MPESCRRCVTPASRSRRASCDAPVTPAVGAALTVLAAASKATTAVEVGAGAGVSGVCLLRGLGRNAVLTTIDSDVDHLRAAREARLAVRS